MKYDSIQTQIIKGMRHPIIAMITSAKDGNFSRYGGKKSTSSIGIGPMINLTLIVYLIYTYTNHYTLKSIVAGTFISFVIAVLIIMVVGQILQGVCDPYDSAEELYTKNMEYEIYKEEIKEAKKLKLKGGKLLYGKKK